MTFDPQISQRMKAAGKEHLLTVLDYHEAGHLIEPPYSPHFRVTNFKKNGRSYDDEAQCNNNIQLLYILLYFSFLRHPWNFQPLFLYAGVMFLAVMLMGRLMCVFQ